MKIVCDASALEPDVLSIDVLARLALGARRAEFDLDVRDAKPELRELVAFLGLDGALGLELQRQTEEREERLGVEEERELGDSAL
jgi:hypothetical protein